MKKALLWSFFIAPLLAGVMIALTVFVMMKKPYSGPEVIFTVDTGDTFGKINSRLYEKDIIHNTRLFHYYAKYKDYMNKMRAGSYKIPTGVTIPEVLEILVHGTPLLNIVTIPEGKNMYEVAAILERAGITSADSFLLLAKDSNFIQELGLEGATAEGYLFPETYNFAAGTPARQVLKTMVELFKKKTANLDFNHPFLNKHQVVILASMVEKETGAKVERPAIAGVFTNRLKKKMRLESDPTTIYGIWERYKGNIKKSDLLELTPYNTYKIPALPVGPISNPSFEAIEAVLSPEKNDYIFFVSKNDGTHVFSKSYKDHVNAVNEYQRKSAQRKGKSWRQLQQ
ncbi:MAG: endolytic transglycosylase MltG [Bacteriovoracaceae bacterium]